MPTRVVRHQLCFRFMRERSNALVLYRSPAALRGFREQRRLRREVASLRRACQLAQAEAKRCASVFEARIASSRETLSARLQQVSRAFGALIADDTLHGSVRSLAKDALDQVMSELDWVFDLDWENAFGGLCEGSDNRSPRREILAPGQLALALGATVTSGAPAVGLKATADATGGPKVASGSAQPPAFALAVDLSSTFRRLAAAAHPDTARTGPERLRRERQMRQLTAAYRQKDVAGLLDLEQAIISGGVAVALSARGRSVKDMMNALRAQRLRLRIQLSRLRLQSPNTLRSEDAMFAPLEAQLCTSVQRLEAALELAATLQSQAVSELKFVEDSTAEAEQETTSESAYGMELSPDTRFASSTHKQGQPAEDLEPGLSQSRRAARFLTGQPGKRRPATSQLQSARARSHSVRKSEHATSTSKTTTEAPANDKTKRDQLAAMLAARIAKRQGPADASASSNQT